MNWTWGQQRHFHKSFYGCHQLCRTWARAVFSFQSPQLGGLRPRPSRWDSACSVQTAGLRGVLQSLLAPTRGSHHNHFLSSLTWNLEAEIQVKHLLCFVHPTNFVKFFVHLLLPSLPILSCVNVNWMPVNLCVFRKRSPQWPIMLEGINDNQFYTFLCIHAFNIQVFLQVLK